MPISLGNTSITGLAAGGLPANAVGTNSLASGAVSRPKLSGFGAALQTVTAVKTDTFSSAGTGDVAITGLSVTLTPTSSSSRFLIMGFVNYDHSGNDGGGGFRFFRNGSHLEGASGNIGVAPTARYWRYVEQSAVVGHHPRVSRLILRETNGTETNAFVYAGDNCSDSGAYQIGTTGTYDYGREATVSTVKSYSVYGGGQRSAYYALQFSDDNSNWNTAYYGIMANYNYATNSGPGCGIYTGYDTLNRYHAITDFGGVVNQDQSGLCRAFHVIDNPATTSALTYDIRFYQPAGDTLYVNRARADPDQGDDGRFASNITVIELAS